MRSGCVHVRFCHSFHCRPCGQSVGLLQRTVVVVLMAEAALLLAVDFFLVVRVVSWVVAMDWILEV